MRHDQIRMVAVGTATQDVFLVGGKIFTPYYENGEDFTHIPLGEKLVMDDVVFASGGNAMNAAVTFARQGLYSEFIGFVGNDPAGLAIARELDDEGVSTRSLHQEDHFKTSYSSILLAPNGERTILRFYGSTRSLEAKDYDLSPLAEADWVYLSSVGSMELLERCVTEAAKHGVQIAFNPGTAELTSPKKVLSLLEDVSVLITNKDEMKKLVQGETMAELVRHAARLVPTVVISDGPNGAIATDGQVVVEAGMYEDVAVTDRTGAGDAFGSGFVSHWAKGAPLEDAMTFASANSTSVVQHIGAKAGILHKGAPLHDMPLKQVAF
ncbi:MAG TPA: carbohydrate kinase family protein [Verrucomicrobiae bacterium]|nr:carbohydrate kinase family protein [Verrucomicrobiae bacterium]